MCFFFQAEDGIRDIGVTGVQTCALPIYMAMIVCYRGKKETTEAFKLLIEELKENARTGKTTFKGEEKYRIMMEGIPCWPYIGYKMKTQIGRASCRERV